MGLLDWFLLVLAALVLPPVLQAIFARRDFPEWKPEQSVARALGDRLAEDRKAEQLERRLPGDVPGVHSAGANDGVPAETLHRAPPDA